MAFRFCPLLAGGKGSGMLINEPRSLKFSAWNHLQREASGVPWQAGDAEEFHEAVAMALRCGACSRLLPVLELTLGRWHRFTLDLRLVGIRP